MRTFRSTLLITTCALAVIGVLLAVGMQLTSGTALTTLTVIAATPLVPALAMLSTLHPLARTASWVLLAGGVLLAGAGAAQLAGQSQLVQFLELASPRSVLLSASSFSAAGWVAIGVAALLTGLGLLVRLQTPVVLGAVLLFASTVFFAGGLLADSGLVQFLIIGPGSGSVSLITVASCAVLALAALLHLTITVVRPVLPAFAQRRSHSGAPVTRRRVAMTAALVTAVAAAGIGVVIWSPWSNPEPLSEVFADPALADCVGDEIGLSADSRGNRYVTEGQLNRVTGLTCSGDTAQKVSSLAGLARLPNLSSVVLRDNSIADLTPLADLAQLRGIDLTSNQITDLTPLAEMTRLAELNIANNEVRDLTPLAGVITLTALDASSNQITDLTPLAGLTWLTELTLPRNQITDVAPLRTATSLYLLDLSDNRIIDPSPLNALPQLNSLVVTGNEIPDAELFSGFPALTELWIGGNPITDVRPLTQLPELVGVDFRGSNSEDIVGLDELRALNVYVGGFAK